MNDVWGNDEDYVRRAAARHAKAKRAKKRARHRKGGGCLLGLVVLPLLVSDEPTWKKIGCGTSLVLWAAVLVPLILYC